MKSQRDPMDAMAEFHHRNMIRFHEARMSLKRLKELKAPDMIIKKASKVFWKRLRALRNTCMLGLYRRLEGSLERARLQYERESDRKFSCAHCDEYLSRHPKSRTNVCQHGGTFGTHDFCCRCPHWVGLRH